MVVAKEGSNNDKEEAGQLWRDILLRVGLLEDIGDPQTS